jgi:regulator of RNase E activity RraA
MQAITIHGADSMEHELCGQQAGASRHCASSWAAAVPRADGIQLMHDRRAACAVNGAIHATAARKRGIGRIHDGISGNTRDVADHQLQDFAVWKFSFHRVADFGTTQNRSGTNA